MTYKDVSNKIEKFIQNQGKNINKTGFNNFLMSEVGNNYQHIL